MTDTTTAPPTEEWAIVEIMGHLRRAGRISEVQRYGATLLRVDIPIAGDTEGETIFVSEFFSGGSIYRLRPCGEDVAREAARQIGDPRPVMPTRFRIAAPEYAPSYASDSDEPEEEFGHADER